MTAPITANPTPILKTMAEVVLLILPQDSLGSTDAFVVVAGLAVVAAVAVVAVAVAPFSLLPLSSPESVVTGGVDVCAAKIQPLMWAPTTVVKVVIGRVTGTQFCNESFVYTVSKSPEATSL